MDMIDAITQVVNNLGFPIAMVVYFIWDKTKITNQMVAAINNNTTIIQKLLTKIDREEWSGDGE